MTQIMYCCVIIHNMVLGVARTLTSLPTEEEYENTIRTGEDVEHCFQRINGNGDRIIPGSIAAMYATNRYLQSVREYMRTRRLVFKHVCG